MSATKRSILLTGAAGRVAQALLAGLAGQYQFRLTDRRAPSKMYGFPFFSADIAQADALLPLCRAMDTVVHLAADPNPAATWDSLLPNNLIGVYNVLEAAHQAGCRRVVFASSVHVALGYPPDVQIRADMPTNPTDLYGATKVWGEAVAQVYARQGRMSVICLRLGTVQEARDVPFLAHSSLLDLVLTPRDLAQLVSRAIEASDELQFGIFPGSSENRWKRFDLTETRLRLNYQPQDDAFGLSRLNLWAGILFQPRRLRRLAGRIKRRMFK